MRIHRSAVSAVAGIALTLSAMAEAKAQTDTTRRAVSEQRIPVRKDVGAAGVTRREVGGEVRLAADAARLDSLEALAASYRTRIDSLERANASLTTRLDATDRHIAALRDSLNMVHSELTTIRTELSATTARTAALADSVVRLNQRFSLFRSRSIFGNSGFYVGLGTGPAYTGAALDELGYVEGMQVTVPIGWHKTGSALGFRSELAWQNYDGRLVPGAWSNNDPNVYSATAMASLHLPFNSAKTHTVYLMGGGGVYHFRDFRSNTALAAAFGGSFDAGEEPDGDGNSETKWGLTAGAGVQFHILGATYLFVQSTFHNVSADQVVAPATNKNLRWIPLVLGVTLR